MGKIFDLDGPFLNVLNKIADIFILNMLLIVCSLPIFTFGAAYTAVYYVTLKMVKNEDSYIVKSFFKSFKQNFRQATIIWLIILAIGFIVIMDLKIMNGDFSQAMMSAEGISKALSVLFMAAGIIYTFTIVYVFPVLSRFDNTIKNTFRNALFMSISHFPYTIAIILITFVPMVIMYFIPRTLIVVCISFGLSAYCNSYLFVKIFKKYMPEEHITSDENFVVELENKDN